MSNITDEEVMASMMKVGDRVRRGKDWSPNWEFDGNGPDTVVEKCADVGMWKLFLFL